MMTLKQLINEAFLYNQSCILVTDSETVIVDKISYDELKERLDKDLSNYASRTVIMTEWYWDIHEMIYRVDITIK